MYSSREGTDNTRLVLAAMVLQESMLFGKNWGREGQHCSYVTKLMEASKTTGYPFFQLKMRQLHAGQVFSFQSSLSWACV